MSPQRSRTQRVRARWRPPPGPPPAAPPELAVGDGETLDFLNGDWRIFQRTRGHRYSTDDLLTAWYACRVATDLGLTVRRALDLGSGVGSVAMIAAWKLVPAELVAVEAQAESAALLRRSLRYNGLDERARVREGDLRDPSLLPEGRVFDLVTGSPPYLAPHQGVASLRPQCAPCRFEQRGGAEDYALAAARALTPRGLYVLVHELRAADRVRAAAAAAGLAVIRVRPIVFREGRAPHIAVYAVRWKEVASEEELEAPLVIRTRDGARGEEYSAERVWMGFPP